MAIIHFNNPFIIEEVTEKLLPGAYPEIQYPPAGLRVWFAYSLKRIDTGSWDAVYHIKIYANQSINLGHSPMGLCIETFWDDWGCTLDGGAVAYAGVMPDGTRDYNIAYPKTTKAGPDGTGAYYYYFDREVRFNNGTGRYRGTDYMNCFAQGMYPTGPGVLYYPIINFTFAQPMPTFDGSPNIRASSSELDNLWVLYDEPYPTKEAAFGETLDKLVLELRYDSLIAGHAGEVIARRELPLGYSAARQNYKFELTYEELFNFASITLEYGLKEVPVYYHLESYFHYTDPTSGEIYHETRSDDEWRKLYIEGTAPTISIQAYDTSPETTYLTGDNKTFIRYFSDVYYAVTAILENGTPSVKGPGLVSCGSFYKEGAMADIYKGTITDIDHNTITAAFIDPRGNMGRGEKTFNWIEYIKLSTRISSVNMAATGEAQINIEGQYYPGSFGAHDNSLTLLVRYKRANYVDYPEGWLTVDPEKIEIDVEGQRYTATYSLDGLDFLQSYKFQVRAYDMLMTLESKEEVVSTIPVFDWGANDFNFNVPILWTRRDGPNAYTYNLSEFFMQMRALVSEEFPLEVTVTPGENYSKFEFAASLIGNNLHCYYSATRLANTGTGDIANEIVGNLKVLHGGKIKLLKHMSVTNGNVGAPTIFQTQNIVDDGNEVSFDFALCSTAAASKSFSGYFTMPVVVNLKNY